MKQTSSSWSLVVWEIADKVILTADKHPAMSWYAQHTLQQGRQE